jgi:hypothetical protein
MRGKRAARERRAEGLRRVDKGAAAHAAACRAAWPAASRSGTSLHRGRGDLRADIWACLLFHLSQGDDGRRWSRSVLQVLRFEDGAPACDGQQDDAVRPAAAGGVQRGGAGAFDASARRTLSSSPLTATLTSSLRTSYTPANRWQTGQSTLPCQVLRPELGEIARCGLKGEGTARSQRGRSLGSCPNSRRARRRALTSLELAEAVCSRT